jgi:hypothetical protein
VLPQQCAQTFRVKEVYMIGREHVRVSHVVSLHLFDTFGIGNRDEHILPRNAERFGQQRFDVGDMLQNFK